MAESPMEEQHTDVIALLHQEHKEVVRLIQEIMKGNGDRRKTLFPEFGKKFSRHMRLEEKHLYAKLKTREESADVLQDALREHLEAKELLKELRTLDYQDEEWRPMFEDLRESAEYHVQVEEERLFPLARQLLKNTVLARVGEKIREERDRLQSGL